MVLRFLTASARAAVIGLAALAGLAASPALAQAPAFSDAQKKAIGEMVRDYLLANPEVIQEALVELEKRQKDAEANAAKTALRQNRAKIFDAQDAIVVGNPKGDVTLVEFYDYNCPYCRRAMENVESLMKADPKLRVVLKDFPVLGPDSVEASKIAVAAKNQIPPARYWEFHKKLMNGPGRANKARAIAVAKEFGADPARLEKDANDPAVSRKIEEIVALGDALSLRGTPAFVIGEEVVFGAVPAEMLSKAVANVRQCGQVSC
jgi:protein-disulfide isomerase